MILNAPYGVYTEGRPEDMEPEDDIPTI